MTTVNTLPLQLKLIKEILNTLNEAFPSGKIPTRLLQGGKIVNTKIQEDPKFSAYKTNSGWYIISTDYFVWRDNYDIIQEFCEYFKEHTGVHCGSCHQHEMGVINYRDAARSKRGGVIMFIGKISWN